ncbi:MAG: triose-phosphate isomerase family protein [bacterium]|nr:triose-phosphate isomerase family protein [bacterium]
MKKPLVVANWKATKTIKETIEWINKAKTALEEVTYAQIIIGASYVSLPVAASLFEGTTVKVSAQDVSKFQKGAYTGEVTIEMLDGLVDYCIVGHSERRKYFGETDDDVIEKVKLLLKYDITPILCVSDLSQLDAYIARGKEIVDSAEKTVFVYEPPGAISGGGVYRPEDPGVANENASGIGNKINKKVTTLYGGSINPENANLFFSQAAIDGGLIGQASTEPQGFLELLSNVKLNLPAK